MYKEQPDRLFTAEQQLRLQSLMAAWRAARDSGESLTAGEGAELQALIDAELEASSQRAAAVSKRSM